MIERKKIFNKKFVDLVFIVLAILLGKYLLWTNVNIIIFALFIWIILHPIPSKILAVPALFFLSATPVVLVFFHNREQADRFAIYAYYFLIMTVIMGIYEIRREDKENKGEVK